ncbi:hypothetical protein KAOT1_05962 [Kordia algicida OT-1]|uniref:AB hydrolase-1 domain-containing protein n=2 Tax=Kordia TaxID=221065 RepID=A9EBD7_9FLAO|nr:hypothetical protein KAOT1_05962 [Kordia algicida OT-1]
MLLCCSFYVHAQELKSEYYTYITQGTDVSAHINKPYKLSANIRKEVFNGNEKVYLFMNLIDASKEGGILHSKNSHNQLVSEEWQTITIEGMIEPTAKTLAFGLMCINNGKFFFDDFKLEVQNKDGTWEKLQLQNPDFEENRDNSNAIWENQSYQSNRNFTAVITKEKSNNDNYCLLVEGKDVYGQNDDKGGFVNVNGVKLYYEIYGKGKPLLLLHGAGQSISAFRSQIDFFSKHYKVIALDSRGRGRSTDNDDELTYVNQAKDVHDFLEKLKLDTVSIIGWSDGGIIGLIVAMKYPEKVEKLIAMAANIHPNGLLPERLQLHKKNIERLEKDEKEKDTFDYKLLKQLVYYPQLKFDDLRSITSPTLIMAGDHDLIQDMHTIKIFQAIPNANLAIFPGETHWFPEDNSKLFNTTVFDFLQKEFKKPNRY